MGSAARALGKVGQFVLVDLVSSIRCPCLEYKESVFPVARRLITIKFGRHVPVCRPSRPDGDSQLLTTDWHGGQIGVDNDRQMTVDRKREFSVDFDETSPS